MTLLPQSTLQLRSTLRADGTVVLELAEVPVTAPNDDQVVIRIEAAPINPSDVMLLLAGADVADAQFEGTLERPRVTLHLSREAVQAHSSRVAQSVAVGLEGTGRVIAAGKNAQALPGHRVAVLSMTAGMFGQFATVTMQQCLVVPHGVSAHDSAGLSCNPLTALAIVETLHQTGHKAMVQTAAASNVGQMLVRICQEDGIALINIVRRAEQVDLLRSMGAQYVCNASAPSFRSDLLNALRATHAVVAFDAIGGGTMASDLLSAMETVAVERLPSHSSYGSSEPKRVYIYGRLNPSPIVMPEKHYGLAWGVEGWAMPPILEKAGAARLRELVQRIVENSKTTFASHYGHEISLAGILWKDVMLGYCRQATGEKYLVNPWLGADGNR
jgi:NADPH2:quinone reductase